MDATSRSNLVQLYREFDARCGRQAHKLASRREFEEELFIPVPEAKQETRRALEGLLKEAADLPAPDPAYSLLRDHFSEFLIARLSDLETTFRHPARFVSGLTRYVDFVGRQDSRPSDERARLLSARAGKADDLWRGVESLFSSSDAAAIRELPEACLKLRDVSRLAKDKVEKEYPGLSSPSRRALDSALDLLAEKAADWGKRAEEALGRAKEAKDEKPGATRPEGPPGGSHAERTTPGAAGGTDPEAYRRILEDELGVDLDEILEWHEDEVRATRDEVFAIASRLNLGASPAPRNMAEVVEALNRFAGPCDTPDEMFSRMRSYLDRAQVVARQYVRLPEESVRVVPTPYQHRDSYPWGGYGGGCQKRRPPLGEVFLNDGNYRAITDGWIKINAVHECYPGHHVQWVRTTLDPVPETVKIGARGVPLLEGACVRTERLMEPVFPEDPFYPLFVAYRRHHTATRIKADLYLRYFGRPIDDVVDLYVEELGFDRSTARGQVKAQELMIGYFTCYYYGFKRLRDLQPRYRMDDKEFSEIIFEIPHVSLATLEKFLDLGTRDRGRVLTEFPSMIPN